MNRIIKGGVRDATTKKALKEAIAADPSGVRFYCPQIFAVGYVGPVSRMPEDVTLNVAGPRPDMAPTWWANITRRGDKFTVR